MLEHASSSPDLEVCGLLGGCNLKATSYYPVENIAAKPDREFLMEPGAQISAMKTMREKDETLTAIFHTHPVSPARPSTRDREMAYYPDTTYLIMSLQPQPPDLNGFYFDGSQFIEISILDEDSR